MNIEKILIIKPSSLGDIVHALPVLVNLRKNFPSVKIDWLVFDQFKDILTDNELLNDIILWRRKKNNILLGIIEFIKVVKKIREKKYSIVIDLQGLFRSGLISFLSEAKYKIGVPGLKEFSHLFETEVSKPKVTEHAVNRNLRVLNFFNIRDYEISFPININNESYKISDKMFNDEKAIITICPFSRIPQKEWPIERFLELALMLVNNHDVKIIWLGSWSSKISMVVKMTDNNPNIINLIGKTSLKDAITILNKSHVIVSNDTGLAHIASALNRPTIGLYGPSDPKLTGLYGENSIMIYKKLPCSPCRKTRPRCKRNYCMEAIKIEEVYNAVVNILKSIGKNRNDP